MPEMNLTLIKGDKHGSETDYRDQLPVNMSGVVRPLFGVAGYMLQQPGLTQYGTGEGIDRGGIYNERLGSHFRVSGTSLIEVATDGTTTVLGTVSGSDTVSLPYSFNTQAIIADGKYYLYDPDDGFRQVTDTDLGAPIDATWVDQYYFFTDGENLFHTEITNEESIDPLDFATSEFSPDPTLGVGKTDDNKVIVFNRYSIEYFRNVATDNFAFTRLPDRAQKAGIVGTHCKAEIKGKWFIMGGRREEDISIHVIGLGSYNKIASREVDKVIGQYTESELSTAVLETRVEENIPYLIVHLPNETLLYNMSIAAAAGNDQAWSILKSDVNGNTTWRGKFGVFEPRKGVWVYGDKQDSTIGILDEDVATHYGELAEWILYTPFVHLEFASIDELNIEIIPGFTTEDDAQVFVSLSYDGVFTGQEYIMQYGDASEYDKRFIRYRFGYVRNWFGYKFRGASTSRMAFSRCKINYG